MSVDMRPNYKDIRPLLAAGKFALFMTDDRQWEIYAVSGRSEHSDVEVLTGRDHPYRAPGYENRDSDLCESVEYVRYEHHVSLYYLTAVFDTEAQADAMAHALMALDAKYEEETRAPRLAYELGLLVALEAEA